MEFIIIIALPQARLRTLHAAARLPTLEASKSHVA